MINYFNKAKKLYFKYEKVILPFSFFVGLLWDNFTLRRVDLPYENVVLAWNIFQTMIYITLINLHANGRLKGRIFDKIALFLPMMLQFAFGGLFSGFIVFYFRSGSIWASWPFMLLLAILFVGNEFFRKRYTHLPFQIGVLFVAIFSYFVFALPVLINRMGALVFLGSGALAMLVCAFLLFILSLIIPARIKQNSKHLIVTIFSIYIIFNIFYFANVIPPIPLVLKDSGIFHSIQSSSTKDYLYEVTFEAENSPYLFFRKQSNIFHWQKGQAIYCYSSIFSPADLDAPIFHRWMHFDEKQGKWVEIARISFAIKGGRVKGYKGYTYLKDITLGKWRVDTTTERGQVLGRYNFTVILSDSAPNLETGLR